MNCIICNKEFIKKFRANKQKCCSKECSNKNYKNLSSKSKDKIYAEVSEYSQIWQIPKYRIIEYGLQFLKDNPIVVETIQLETKLSGHFEFLTEEEKQIRRTATVRQANEKAREGKVFTKVKNCKICNSEYTPGIEVSNNSTTCSKVCSDKLHDEQASACQKRKNERLKEKRKQVVTNENIINRCENCHTDFNPSKYNKTQKYCKTCKETHKQKLYK